MSYLVDPEVTLKQQVDKYPRSVGEFSDYKGNTWIVTEVFYTADQTEMLRYIDLYVPGKEHSYCSFREDIWDLISIPGLRPKEDTSEGTGT